MGHKEYLQSKKKAEKESIILYAKMALDLDEIYQLKSPKYIRRFLDLILRQETREQFSGIQYCYAVNLLLGRPIRFKNEQEAVQFLFDLRRVYEKV